MKRPQNAPKFTFCKLHIYQIFQFLGWYFVYNTNINYFCNLSTNNYDDIWTIKKLIWKKYWVWNDRTTVGVKRPGCETTGTRYSWSYRLVGATGPQNALGILYVKSRVLRVYWEYLPHIFTRAFPILRSSCFWTSNRCQQSLRLTYLWYSMGKSSLFRYLDLNARMVISTKIN